AARYRACIRSAHAAPAWSNCDRQVNCEHRSSSRLAFTFDLPVVRMDDRLSNRQSQTAALGFGGRRGTEKSLEDVRQVFLCDADALILKRNPYVHFLGQRDADARA